MSESLQPAYTLFISKPTLAEVNTFRTLNAAVAASERIVTVSNQEFSVSHVKKGVVKTWKK